MMMMHTILITFSVPTLLHRTVELHAQRSVPSSLRPIFHHRDSYTTIAQLYRRIYRRYPCQSRCFFRSVRVISAKRGDSSCSLPSVIVLSDIRRCLDLSEKAPASSSIVVRFAVLHNKPMPRR